MSARKSGVAGTAEQGGDGEQTQRRHHQGDDPEQVGAGGDEQDADKDVAGHHRQQDEARRWSDDAGQRGEHDENSKK